MVIFLVLPSLEVLTNFALKNSAIVVNGHILVPVVLRPDHNRNASVHLAD